MALKPLYDHERDGQRQHELWSPNLKPLPYGSRMADDSRILHSALFRFLANKTQLFPQSEGPLVRNRLTHSLEVADIACRIARKLNRQPGVPFCVQQAPDSRDRFINETYIRAACYAHDLGHPPFGHSGEQEINRKVLEHKHRSFDQKVINARLSELQSAIDSNSDDSETVELKRKADNLRGDIQKANEGYEGNAQTLRIISKLEKRFAIAVHRAPGDPSISRFENFDGLNLTVRSLASVLKYDGLIGSPNGLDTDGRPTFVKKGYYSSEERLVSRIREIYEEALGASIPKGEFRTLECSIMDLADDIAYSTYDFEDAMIMGEINPLSALEILEGSKEEVFEKVLSRVNGQLEKMHYGANALGKKDFQKIVMFTFGDLAAEIRNSYAFDTPQGRIEFLARTNSEAVATRDIPRHRRYYSEGRIDLLINSVILDYCHDAPFLSQVRLNERALLEMLTRKSVTFELVTMSHPLRIFDQKAKRILGDLFDLLLGDGAGSTEGISGLDLLPINMRDDYLRASSDGNQERFVADFLASLSEQACIELHKAALSGDYVRLKSLNFFG